MCDFMGTYCNPLDLGYRYQHMKEGERIAGFREGADPTPVSYTHLDVYKRQVVHHQRQRF